MNSYNDDIDRYEAYAEALDPARGERRKHRKKRQKASYHPKKSESDLIAESAETIGLEGGFDISYTPAKHERLWLMESLREFYQQELISDVEALIKGGKEANVYRCAAHPATGQTWLAAKIYRPRMFRNLRNDHRYRLGRTMLLPNGRPVSGRDERLKRALAGKTSFGRQVAHISWLMHEYAALELLYEAGGSVPEPFAAGENGILMGYAGDDKGAAPALNEIALDPLEAQPLFSNVISNIDLMLAHGRVHGDLSAYNILYWNGDILLIDFPQVVYSRSSTETGQRASAFVNPDAFDILARDIERVCDYFSRQGVRCDADRLLRRLWARYESGRAAFAAADASRWQAE